MTKGNFKPNFRPNFKPNIEMKCFLCRKPGHLKKNCWQFRKNYGESSGRPRCDYCKKLGHLLVDCWFKKNANKGGESSNAFVSFLNICNTQEALTLIDTSNMSEKDWCLDSGASDHMCYDKSQFDNLEKVEERRVKVGNGSCIDVQGMGKIKLQAWNGEKWIETVLNDVLYVPELKINLFSVGKALDRGMLMKSNQNKCEIIDENGNVRAVAMRQGKLFKMFFKIEEKISQSNYVESLIDWHKRLAHINFDQIRKVLKRSNIHFKDIERAFCKDCLAGKQHRLPFNISKSRATTRVN